MLLFPDWKRRRSSDALEQKNSGEFIPLRFYCTEVSDNIVRQLLHPFFALAAAHQTLPAYDPVLVWQYDMIIRANIEDFYKDLRPTLSVNGKPTWTWNYVALKNNTEEAGMGIHGASISMSDKIN